ncbi:hypothetical protein H3Z83_10875 [Tenacibaculum sp. S7007]|uniref:Uncharacterized protein n=1 Tax=Tenacibaculum pelagium TaxID=2759527 RepID=A0A839ATS9_9FLAO|nr:hypothetical protein [Tenacibaculum pelagium]MBA6157021.1 hypothetical protein [Tenacibaculum pelagium]
MNKPTRIRIYLAIAATFFFISLFKLDFDDLSWTKNSRIYVRMLVAVLVYIVIFLSSKKLNK